MNNYIGSTCIFLLFSFLVFPASSIRLLPENLGEEYPHFSRYVEAPEYRNGEQCSDWNSTSSFCDGSLTHIAMTLDSEYLRGSMAAVHSILKHASCPENIFFHFVSASGSTDLTATVKAVFPYLSFRAYAFGEERVRRLISSSVRRALENPLNYARIYLAEMIDPCVDRVIYLDSDVVVVDDIQKLWSVPLPEDKVIAAPEYCQVNFTKYFTEAFWGSREISAVFDGKRPCYFNTGVMVMDLGRWRTGGYTVRIEKWMEIQRERRIYELGSLPPFLLVFGGEVEGINHKWNQHGLGGENLANSCRELHSGPVSLLHWSGKGKPWVRLDDGMPCPVDHLWAPYDLYIGPRNNREVLQE